MIIDLHTHSYYSSDGKLTIPELLDYYSPGDIVALTDHETIGGWNEFKTEAKKRGIRPVLGVEWFAGEHHILSYFLKGEPDDFHRYMKMRRKKEKECMKHVFTILKQRYPRLGSYDAFIKSKPHPEKILSVAVLANEIAIISKIMFKEAVHKIRSTRRTLPETQQQETFYAKEIIEKINSWGAVSILAHPYYENDAILTNYDIEKKIRAFKPFGIQGVEAIAGKLNGKIEKHILFLCDELGLLPSVGSDFHYLGKGLEPKNLKEINKYLIVRVKKWLKKMR
jgi:3',5'-nucleoside bisphosphate phosphatase